MDNKEKEKSKESWWWLLLVICLLIWGGWKLWGKQDWTLSLYKNDATVMRQKFNTMDSCINAGEIYTQMDRFDCGLSCNESINLSDGLRCKKVCGTNGCRH